MAESIYPNFLFVLYHIIIFFNFLHPGATPAADTINLLMGHHQDESCCERITAKVERVGFMWLHTKLESEESTTRGKLPIWGDLQIHNFFL